MLLNNCRYAVFLIRFFFSFLNAVFLKGALAVAFFLHSPPFTVTLILYISYIMLLQLQEHLLL